MSLFGSLYNYRTGVTTTHFELVERKHKFSYICETCGNRRTTTIVESATVNPFNKNESGVAKSWLEVVEDVDTKLKQRVKEIPNGIHTCSKCYNEHRELGFKYND